MYICICECMYLCKYTYVCIHVTSLPLLHARTTTKSWQAPEHIKIWLQGMPTMAATQHMQKMAATNPKDGCNKSQRRLQQTPDRDTPGCIQKWLRGMS